LAILAVIECSAEKLASPKYEALRKTRRVVVERLLSLSLFFFYWFGLCPGKASKDLQACDQNHSDVEDKLLWWGFGRRHNQCHTSGLRAMMLRCRASPHNCLFAKGQGLVGRDGVPAEMFGALWRRKVVMR
jgi:hypothetical protein